MRLNCICGGARTAFGDGAGEWRAQAWLTTFGVFLIKEMERLGMIVDLTHMTDRSFFDSMEVAEKLVLVSHVGVRKVCDERLKLIGANGGLIGMEIVKTELKKGSQETGEVVTYDTVVDHIADLIGVRHICLGLDFDNFDLVHSVFRVMSPAPGSIEGFYTGIPKGDHILNEPSNVAEAYVIADYLAARGYGDEDILGILGDNARRFLKATIG